MKKDVKTEKGRRREIVEAARHLFQTKDYEKTTMQEVMNALQIAKGTIYHYFKSKEDLFEAVIEEIVEESIAHMQALLKKAKGNALEKLKLLVQSGRIASDHKNILDRLHQPGHTAIHSRLLAATLVKQAPLYAELIQQGCKEGNFKTETPLECAEFILSAMQFLTDMGIYPWLEKDLNRRIEAFPKLIEQQLQAPAGSFQFLFD